MYHKIIRRLASSLLMALVTVVAMAQDITVSGVVKDNTGQPVPGAAVVVAGTTIGTATDFDGTYTLSVPADATLSSLFRRLRDRNLTCRGPVHHQLHPPG